MTNITASEPVVLVVHCVDSEGPIGGDVRRNPDGTKEFMDNWTDILSSLTEITDPTFRSKYTDSFNSPYRYNWFIMDFTGFKTNPKNRRDEYNDTYDHIKSLNASMDTFHWHDHHVPASGIGDQWSDDWDSSTEYLDILAHRLMDRGDFPEAFRAGGTIEDNRASHWLEDNLLADYSNRVSYSSFPTDNIFDFNWFGTPAHWGFYHPSREDFQKPGDMRRYIVRCPDLKSRFHTLQQWEVDECFGYAKMYHRPVILSYFSHDHRDMRKETYYAIDLIKSASARFGIPWKSVDALEAIQTTEGLKAEHISIVTDAAEGKLHCRLSGDSLFQKLPFVAVRNSDCVTPLTVEMSNNSFSVDLTENYSEIGIACISSSGNKTIKRIKL